MTNGHLYGRETPHGHPIGGREAAVEALTRDELVGLHQSMFLNAKPTFLLVGDIDADAAAKQIESAFSGWRAQTTPPTVGSDAKREAQTIYLIDKPGAAQSVISAGQVTVERSHPDYMPLVVMNMTFGGQFTARLNMNLREDKGYTYGYRSRFDWRRSRSAYITGGSVQTAVTREALFETLKEFNDLVKDRPISEDEFEKARLGLIQGLPAHVRDAGPRAATPDRHRALRPAGRPLLAPGRTPAGCDTGRRASRGERARRPVLAQHHHRW